MLKILLKRMDPVHRNRAHSLFCFALPVLLNKGFERIQLHCCLLG